MLPVGGIIVGVIALLLGGYAVIALSKVNKTLADQDANLTKRVEAAEAAANNAADVASKTDKKVQDLRNQTQAGFDQMSKFMQDVQTTVSTLEAKMKAPAAADKGGKNAKREPVTAGPGEYIVKAGDTGMKIAQANHVSVSDLQAVNPGVNWTKLKIGDKIKLPSTAAKK